ncbi:MAG: hypothetical protein ACI8U3_002033 [Brevundimonas sp.]|jgi:hypothetical protein|uniref:DUF2946 family protein n=1 Tax=Brevundimonas sp. TaxID=1871086 RepID=UPI0039E68F5D
MTTRADTWTLWRSLAFLAAVFAVVLGALLPSAALAGSRDGRPIVMCSAEGPRTIRVGGDGDQTSGLADAACAFCIAAQTPALPPPSPPQPLPVIRPATTVAWTAAAQAAPPPARASPRPHSTAPPLA